MKGLKKIMYASVALSVALTSCNSEEAIVEEQSVDISEVKLSAEIDKSASIVSDIIIDAYEAQESNELGRVAENQNNSALPDCVTITVIAQQGFREITLDFGAEGCMINGDLLRGQIIFSYDRDPEAQQILISYNLVDFYVNAKNIIGSKTLLRELSNDNGNPQFTHTLDLTVIWPNGVQASREGVRIREWVEGAGSGIFSDNVFEITGNWTTTFVNGNSHSYEVITPLRREVICNYFVSGSLDVQRTNFSGVFDYGIGDCDNEAEFTFNNGTVIDITLN